MKKKKLALIVAFSVAGNYFLPISGALTANADQLNTKSVKQVNLKESNNTPLEQDDINFYNIWGGKSAKVEFNTDTMKIEASRVSGDLGNGNNTYMQLFLYSAKDNKVEINEGIKDGSSSNLTDLLNDKSFNFGDIIGINFEEGTNGPNIDGVGTIPKNSMTYYKITEQGLVKYIPNVKVNPFQILTGGTVTSGIVSGNGLPNSKVTATVEGKTFTGETNAKGEFSFNVEDSQGFSENTKVNLEIPSEIGMIARAITPSLSKSVNLNNSKIEIVNNWGSNAGEIGFNPANKTFEVSGYNNYLGLNGNNFLNISVYNPTTGKFVYTDSFNGNENTSAVYKALNNKSFNYGDIIMVSYDSQQGNLNVTNNGKNVQGSWYGPSYYKITEQGLVSSDNNPVEVNPFNILGEGNPNLKTGTIKGQANPNTEVSVRVGNKTFTGESDSKGNFSISISSETPFNQSTNIIVYSKGRGIQTINPSMNIDSLGMTYASIGISATNGMPLSTVSFNPVNMQMNVQNNESNFGDSGNTNFFNLNVYNKELNKEMYSGSFASNGNTADLSKELNGKTFEYGDVIGVSYNSSLGNVQVVNNPINVFNTKVNTEKMQYFILTKKGIKPFNQVLTVNPFGVLNGENVTKGDLTGTANPNAKITVNVGGKEFLGTANSKGDFSINIEDLNGFNYNTLVTVMATGSVPIIIHPTAPANLGINGQSLTLPNNCLGTAQNISFDPSNMTINEYGNSFLAELINPNNGQVKSSIGNSNFSVFNSKNNLSGANFKYGDILTVYEPEESYLSDGDIELVNGTTKTDINADGQFKSYVIEPQGLVPVENKSLENVTAEYVGNSEVNISGKTDANGNVTIYYGSSLNMSKVVKANEKGEFNLKLPIADAQLGAQVEVYLNKDNIQSTLVTYDSKKYDASNSIQIINNANFPVIGLNFNFIDNEIQANVNQYYKTYAGVFYGNKMNISLLSKDGKIIKSVTSSNPGEIQSFANELNNLKFTDGDILKVQYDKNYVTANVIQDKKEIGNTTGAPEYFKITNKGLVNLTEKFVTINPLNIINGSKVTEATLTGKAGKNETVTVNVNGKDFTGKTDANGKYSVNITDANGFNLTTNISVSVNGYLPSNITPSYSSKAGLQNSSINCYINGYTFEMSNIASKIGFNIENQTFEVHNYTDSLGNGQTSLFNLSLYNKNGQEIYKDNFNNGSTQAISEALNGKKYEYGDIIGLSFNPTNYKPVVLNGNNTIGNINGQMEYFQITPEGLVSVNFGQKTTTTNVSWNNGNLKIVADLGKGNTEAFLNANKNLVLVNSDNKIIASEKMTSETGNESYTGTFTKADLQKITEGNNYNVELEVNGKLIPLTIGCNTPSFDNYVLSGNSSNGLTINLKGKQYVTLTNKNEIGTYANTLSENIQKINGQKIDFNGNIAAKNSVIASEFINRVGVQNLENLYGESSQNASFLNWLLNNTTAMEEFLSGPNPDATYEPEDQPTATYTQCLQVWSNIWNTYTNSHYGFNLKLAIAVALTNGEPIMSFPAGTSVGSPVERYNIFETLNAQGGMLPEFSTLDVSHLCFITNIDIANDQIIDMRNVLLQNHNGLIGEGTLHNGAYTINYNTRNPYTGASVFGNDFYGPNSNIYSVWYAGGVCGATGMMGGAVEKVFGIPATQTPQTGHNAFIWYDAQNNQWEIGNAVDGWSATYDADMSTWSSTIAPNSQVASYNVLYQAADNGTLAQSNMYKYLASTQTSYNAKLQDLQKAIQVNSLNLGAWIDLVNLEKNNGNTTITQYNELVSSIIKTFNDYPMPMYDLLLQLKSTYMTKGSQEDFNNYVTTITNTLNNQVNNNLPQSQSSVSQYLLTQMNGNGLFIGDNELVNSSITLNNVWNQNMANIGFDPANKTLTVSNGGNASNPYGKVEAFTLKLEDSQGKVLKEITVNEGNYSAGQDISNALNGAKFSYGDKIVINYENSSLITLNNVILKDGEKGNVSLKQGVKTEETVYITQKGLSYNENITKPVVKKPAESKPVVNKPTESKPVVNKPAKDTNTDKPVVKKPDISSNKNTESEQLTAAKDGLRNAINEGKVKLKSNEYNEESNKQLQKMLNSANEILNSKSSNVGEYKQMTELLENTMNELIKAPTVKEKDVLTKEINVANEDVSDSTINGDFGYTKISVGALMSIINDAKEVLNNPNTNEVEINNAINKIKQGVKALKNNIEPLEKVIQLGNSKLGSKEVYTKESRLTLEKAVVAGYKIINNNLATLDNVKNATDTIQKAIDGLKIANVDKGTVKQVKSNTNKKITESNSSDNGYITLFTDSLNKVTSILGNENESELYTEASIKALQQRLVLGSYIINNKYNKEQTIEATELINYTLNKLQKRPEVEGLINVIKTGQNKVANGSQYTEESISDLNAMIMAGDQVLNNNNATTTQVTEATQKINGAINNLSDKSQTVWNSVWNLLGSIF
ncbi:MAG: hypothetical protein ACRDAU_00460 [Clostridium sp.]